MSHNWLPESPDTIALALEAQRADRVVAFATMRADMDDVCLRTCHPALRAAYLVNAETYFNMKLPGIQL